MSIEMENPETLVGKIDAAWNYVTQIRLAMSVGDMKRVLFAQTEASRLLSLAMDEAGENEYDGPGLIRDERRRQIVEKGRTPEHDDDLAMRELVSAAIAYASGDGDLWPWGDESWKPSKDDKRNLVKAGALIAAEIDRLQRIEMREIENDNDNGPN